MTFAIKGDRILNDREPIIINGAGDSIRNPIMAGLGYTITISTNAFESAIQSVILAASTEIDFDVLSAQKFPLNAVANGDFVFSGVVGGAQDPTGIAVAADPAESISLGVGVYLSMIIRTTDGQEFLEEKKINFQSPLRNHMTFNGIEYVSPYAVQVRSRDVDVFLIPEWKDDVGVKRFGGAATVEIFDDPLAPSVGPFITSGTSEVDPSTLTTMKLATRNSGTGLIPNYVVPPYTNIFASGTDNLSHHFYFLNIRYRSIAGSAIFVDIPAVLFADQECGVKNDLLEDDVAGFGLPPITPPPTTNGPPTITPPTRIPPTAPPIPPTVTPPAIIVQPPVVPPGQPFPPPAPPGPPGPVVPPTDRTEITEVPDDGLTPSWDISISDPAGALISGTYFAPQAQLREVLVFESDPVFPAASAPAKFIDKDTVRVREQDFTPPLASLPFIGGYFFHVQEFGPDRTESNAIFPAPFDGLAAPPGIGTFEIDSMDDLIDKTGFFT